MLRAACGHTGALQARGGLIDTQGALDWIIQAESYPLAFSTRSVRSLSWLLVEQVVLMMLIRPSARRPCAFQLLEALLAAVGRIYDMHAAGRAR